jgi:carboxylesterase
MIEINETFTVAAPPAEVYAVLSDPHAVVECVAGAGLGEQHEDGSYDGTMTVKFSALRISFAGRVALELDDEARQGTVKASGRDGQGGTKFQATATFRVEPEDGGASSRVHANGDVVLSGKLASVIENAATAVVRRMTADFVEALSVRCASGSAQLGPSLPAAATEAAVASAPTEAAAPAVDVAPSGEPTGTSGAAGSPTVEPVAASVAPDQPAPLTPTAGVLLLHGFGGSPNSVRPLGQALADAGYSVSIPRLPGHGTRWKDLGQTTAADWYAAVDAEFTRLRAAHSQVFVLGISVGATLALRLGELHPIEVAGIVAINPATSAPVGTPKPLGFFRLFRRSVAAKRGDIKKPGQSDVGYERLSLRAIQSLVTFGRQTTADLGRVRCPVLLATSKEDHVVAGADATAVWNGLGSATKTREVFDNSYHVITLDNDASRLIADSVSFVEIHSLVSR